MAKTGPQSAPSPAGSPAATGGWWTQPVFVCLALALVTLAVYWPVLACDFINYDDPGYVSDNDSVQAGLTWSGFKWAFQTTLAGNWHPLTWLSFMLDVQLFGRNSAAGAHFMNLLLHVASALLVFLVLRKLTAALWRSALVAALFALHPLHVESVAWISERKDTLSTLFWMLSMLFYARYARPQIVNRRSQIKNYSLSLFFFLCGLMSKPMLVTLPFVLLLLDYWPLRRFPFSAFRLQLLSEKLPFFAFSAVFCAIAIWAQKVTEAVVRLSDLPVDARIENAFVSYARYLGKTFWPVSLATPYPHPTHWPFATVALAVALVIGLCLLVLWFGRRLPFLVTGWFWFLGTMIPVIGLVQVGGQSMADRYTYVPLVGMFIMLVWSADEAFARWRPSPVRDVALGTAVALALTACAARTADQLRYWRDSETLFGHAIAVTQNNSVAYGCLGLDMIGQGRLQESLEYLLKDVRLNANDTNAIAELDGALARIGRLDEAGRRRHALDPQYEVHQAKIRGDFGEVLAEQRRYDEAVRYYESALRVIPDDAEIHNRLGTALVSLGRLDEAAGHFRAAINFKPGYANPLSNLAGVLFLQHKYDDSVSFYNQALALKPDYAEAHDHLASVLATRGQLAAAVDHYYLALRFSPDMPKTHFELGCTLFRLGNIDEAVSQLSEALRLKPDYAAAHDNLGRILLNQSRFKAALNHFTEAARFDAADPQAQFDAGLALERLGRTDEAVMRFREALRLKPDYAESKAELRGIGIQ